MGDQHPTQKLSIDEIVVSWPKIVAELEKLEPWGTFALRLGLIELARQCLDEMALASAGPDHVVKMRQIVEALAKLPWG